MEQLDIRRASDEFAEQVEEYRKYFRARAPFAVADPELTLAHVRESFVADAACSCDGLGPRQAITKQCRLP